MWKACSVKGAAFAIAIGLVTASSPVHADGTGVTIHRPPGSPPASARKYDLPDEPVAPLEARHTHPPKRVSIIIDVTHTRRFLRRQYVNRILFQRYLGFKRVYRGRRYPF